MDAKSKAIKPKTKKPVKKGKKPKPKTKLKQKQTQKQTQKVIVNIGNLKKRTRKVYASKKKPMLSSFSGSAQSPLLINPFDNVYRDLINPLKDQQRHFQQQQRLTMEKKKNELDELRKDFRRGFIGINEKLSQLQPTGDVTQQVAEEKADLQKGAFEESRRLDAEQPEGTAVSRQDAFESSSAAAPSPAPIPVQAEVLAGPSKNARTRAINNKIKEYYARNEKLPSKSQAKAFARNADFQRLNISKGEIEETLQKYKKSMTTRAESDAQVPPASSTRSKKNK